jgi:hypothetical protein
MPNTRPAAERLVDDLDPRMDHGVAFRPSPGSFGGLPVTIDHGHLSSSSTPAARTMPLNMPKLRKALVAIALSVLAVGILTVAMPVAALWATQKYYAEHTPGMSPSTRDNSRREPARIRCTATSGQDKLYTRCS